MRPREYPVQFGLKIVELYLDMIKDNKGQPTLPDPVPSAEQTFESMSFEDMWPEADLVSVIRYLRGAKSLGMPDSFRPLVPECL